MARKTKEAQPERLEICKNCRHCWFKKGEELQCRFNPPSFVYDPSTGCTVVAHPIVNADHWCSQFGPYLSS